VNALYAELDRQALEQYATKREEAARLAASFDGRTNPALKS